MGAARTGAMPRTALITGLIVWLFAGPSQAAQPELDCQQFNRQFDLAVLHAGVGDPRYHRLSGFPALRSDRFIASFDPIEMTDEQFSQWLSELQRRGLESAQYEWANLPPAAKTGLLRITRLESGEVLSALENCADAELTDSRGLRRRLKRRAAVPDDYLRFNQILGLNPLTSIGVRAGIKDWHAELQADFAAPLAERIPVGSRHLYETKNVSYSDQEISRLVATSRNNALGIPLPSAQVAGQLFAAHSPRWVIETQAEFDRPGAPKLLANGMRIDTTKPTIYTLLSWTRVAGRVLLQLNYMVWFSERPKEPGIDLLGGQLDGLTWRVTLDEQGRPLLYDSVHHCGCYHLFFPRADLQAKPGSFFTEPVLIPATMAAGRRPSLVLTSGSHYLIRVLADAPDVAKRHTLAVTNYAELRSLATPTEGLRRGLFQPDGLVPGSERNERYVLWPMGVPEPGAMRIYGHHATAFIGRRHFDQPDLIPRLFSLRRD